MALFSVENRDVGNWSSEEDERRAAQLGELGGGVELHEDLKGGGGKRAAVAGRPAGLQLAFNGVGAGLVVVERREVAARAARRHRVTGWLGQAHQ